MKLPQHATAPVAVAALLLAVMAVHAATFRNMFALGEVQSEITHRIFALPVFVVLLWQARATLRWPQVKPTAAGVVLLALLGTAWAAGELTFIRALSEVAVVAMIPAAVLAVFGWKWLAVLSFPLFFLLFAVPLRGPLVDWQVALTADFVHSSLRATGIPVHRDGAFFELPGKSWSVADECSGVEYLSACLMFGVLYAWTMFSNNRKRAWFVAGAAILGIAGNWLRAYLTIALAHLSGNRLFAEGHGTFGWIFFAVLLFLYCWAGWRNRDSAEQYPTGSAAAGDAREGSRPQGNLPMKFLALVALIAWPVGLTAIPIPSDEPVAEISAPSVQNGWAAQDGVANPWMPQLKNAAWTHGFSYARSDSDAPVQLVIGGFSRQSWNAKLVTSVHELAPPGWSQVRRDRFATTVGGASVEGRAIVVRNGSERFRVWQWYALHGQFTGADTTAKWLQLKARLAGKPDRGYWIAVAIKADKGAEQADEALRSFTAALGEPLARKLFP